MGTCPNLGVAILCTISKEYFFVDEFAKETERDIP